MEGSVIDAARPNSHTPGEMDISARLSASRRSASSAAAEKSASLRRESASPDLSDSTRSPSAGVRRHANASSR